MLMLAARETLETARASMSFKKQGHSSSKGLNMKTNIRIAKASMSIALMTASLSLFAEPLRCPEGTTIKDRAIPSMGIRSEWCEDANGIKEGTQRYIRDTITL